MSCNITQAAHGVLLLCQQHDNEFPDAHIDCPAYRTRQKPKIDIVLMKTPEFDDIIAAESQPLSPTDDHTASADTATEIAKPSVTADGQIGPLDLPDGPSEGGPLAASPLADGPVHAGPLKIGKVAEGPRQHEASADGPLSNSDPDSSDH